MEFGICKSSSAGEPTFRRSVKRGRLMKEWSVAAAAKACGYSSQQWRNFESGKNLPAIERVQGICDVLGLPLFRTFRLWAKEKLVDRNSSALAQILGSLPADSAKGPLKHFLKDLPKETQALVNDAAMLSMDATTASLAFDIIDLIARYRKSLTIPSRHEKRLRVISVNKEPSEFFWFPFPGKTLTKQHAVGWSSRGLGYMATVVQIDVNCGAFHKHIQNRYLDGGTEFFSVLDGVGVGFFEHPNTGKWKVHDLAQGTVGYYRGDHGHAYINCGDSPLLIYIVCFPFPPTLEERGRAVDAGQAEGVEFRLQDLGKTSLSDALKKAIKQKLASPMAKTSGQICGDRGNLSPENESEFDGNDSAED